MEFFDYNCPYCRASLPAMKKYYAQHKGDDALRLHRADPDLRQTWAERGRRARPSLAARRQGDKYVAFHFALMGEDGSITQEMIDADATKCGLDVAKLNADMADPAIDAAVDAAQALARRTKIDGTPTFIANGRLRAGAVDDAALRDLMGGKAI